MSYPGRTFHRKPAPSKAAQRINAQLVVFQRQSRGLGLSDADAVSIARCYGLDVVDVRALWDAEVARRAQA